jgi:hypothetical protein
MNHFNCFTCDKRHDFTPYLIAHKNEKLIHTCCACGAKAELYQGEACEFEPGVQNPQKWAARGHWPQVVIQDGPDTMPLVFAYQYDGKWFAIDARGIANIEFHIAKFKAEMQDQPELPFLAEPEPVETPWYDNMTRPVHDGWYDIKFMSGVAPKRWWWCCVLGRWQFDIGSPVQIPMGSIVEWRGQDKPSK